MPHLLPAKERARSMRQRAGRGEGCYLRKVSTSFLPSYQLPMTQTCLVRKAAPQPCQFWDK